MRKTLKGYNSLIQFIKGLLEHGLENAGLYYSTYMGIVFDRDDPENLQRLKLIIPQVSGNQAYEYWAFPKGVYYGQNYGQQVIPQRGDVVYIEFIGGRPEVPVWMHGHPARKEQPKNKDFLDKDTYWFVSPKGHSVIINDTKKLIRIETPLGDAIELNEQSISLVSKKIKSISLGSLNQSKEPSVLGDTLETLLLEMLDDIGDLQAIRTSSGITFKISTSPGWTPLKNKWKQKFKDFKSKLVNLD